MSPLLSLAQEYSQQIPPRIREYLRQERGLPDSTIERFQLGWNGHRITIPIFDREGRFAFFKLAKDPQDLTSSPKMVATPGAKAELYGWERVLEQSKQIIICEGEFDRLVLESRGFAAVTSTGGALTFRKEWADAFREIPHVYICFDNDESGRSGAERIARLIPHSRIVRHSEEVGQGGDVTDFFVRLSWTREDFLRQLEEATPLAQENGPTAAVASRLPTTTSSSDEDLQRLKSRLAIEDIISRYILMHRSGQNLIGRCPFHDDTNPSFTVYPQTQSFYCFGCQAHGDIFGFLMQMEKLTFPEAVAIIRRLSP